MITNDQKCDERFCIKESDIPNNWECTDKLNHIVVGFEDKKFSDTKKLLKTLDNYTDKPPIQEIFQEMKIWLQENHLDKVCNYRYGSLNQFDTDF